MKKYYLREESVRTRSFGDNSLTEPILLFKWFKLSKNKYIVILPKLFNRAAGDMVCILNEKQFLKQIDQLNLEAK